jgi:secreted trypsin-like serine protease
MMQYLVLLSLSFVASLCFETVIPKIVGGKAITYDEAPYQAALIYRNLQICGGSVLNTRFILSAAHCTHNLDAESLSIFIGSENLSSGGDLIKVMSYLNHPKYVPSTFDYDFSIIKIEVSQTFPSNVAFTILPSPKDKLKKGDSFLISGWGETKSASDDRGILRGSTVPFVDAKSCKKNYGAKKITSRMICAGFKLGGIDTCQGDYYQNNHIIKCIHYNFAR